jgi:putative thioredoxin
MTSMADVTDATFETDVIERSKTVPVVIDLWAEWCGPCKTLTPILEKVIGETQGLVELAKVNVDENPEVGKAFQVQSIPAVYAMRDGQVVDGFMGAQGEPQVVEFVQQLIDGDTTIVPGEEDPTISEPGDDAIVEEAPAPEPEPVFVSEAEGAAIEAELTELLLTVKTDDEARERFVELLDQLGQDDPRTNTYRRRLATALF